MNETLAVDGTNVCGWHPQTKKGDLNVLPLLTLLTEILKAGDDFYCVFDANTPYKLRENGRADEADYIEHLLSTFPDIFYIVTGSTRADGSVLHYADHNNCRIVTKDLYQDSEYLVKYRWLADRYTKRLVQGNLQPSGLMTIEKLSYGNIQLVADLEDAKASLDGLLSMRSNRDFTALDRAIASKREALTALELECQLKTKRLEEISSKLRTKEHSLYELETHFQGASTRESFVDTEYGPDTLQQEVILTTQQVKHEAACIRKTLEAINKFLEPQRNCFGDDVNIPFHGSSWKVAVRGLELYFASWKTCTNCYNKTFLDENQCRSCSKGELTHNPEEIWEIVDSNSPSRCRLDPEMNPSDDQPMCTSEREEQEASCIARAQKEIKIFLEPYRDPFGDKVKIPFKGSSWKVAVKGLKAFFDVNRICTNCYNTNLYEKAECLICEKGIMTDSPEEIWSIVNSNTPKKNNKDNKDRNAPGTQAPSRYYKSTLEQEDALKKQQIELREKESACIESAQKEISRFMEPYRDAYGGQVSIPFKGSSWKAAVKGLDAFFNINRICTTCYNYNSVFKGECLTCRKGKMTDKPKKIWKIVNSNAPDDGLIATLWRGLGGR